MGIFDWLSGKSKTNNELISAAKGGNLDEVRGLVEKGADVNAKGKEGATPLMFASGNGHLEVVKELIENGADVNAKGKDASTALIFAGIMGHVEVIKELIEKGADVNARDDDGDAVLLRVAAEGHVEVVKELIERGANVNAKNNDGDAVLLRVAAEGHVEVVKELIERGANVNAKNNDGITALVYAIRYDHIKVVNLLIERGADVNAKDNDGATVLMWAVKIGHIDAIMILIEKGADVNAKHKRLGIEASLFANAEASVARREGDVAREERYREIERILSEAEAKVGLEKPKAKKSTEKKRKKTTVKPDVEKLKEKKMESNTKIDPQSWTRTGQTLDEELRRQAGKLPPNTDLTAIINLADYIAPKMENAFQVCVLNGESHAVANVAIEDEKIPLLEKSVKNNWVILRASFHQYPEYPLVYVRRGIFFSATRLQKGAVELAGVLIECLPDFTDANFQEWALTMRKTLNTIVDIYDLEDRNLASGKLHFEESVIDDLIKSIDQANSALKTIPKIQQDIKTAVRSFYRDYSKPFL